MKKLLKILLALLVILLAGAGAGYWWAATKTASILAQKFDVQPVDLPVPYPAADGSVSLQAAIARGKHLVEARYPCIECHGGNFGGGVMLNDPLVGTFLGPNLTSGKGSRVANYRMADWDRTVRHGVKPDGHPTPMPSEDFRRMTDQELADIIAYVRSVPPIDNEVPHYTVGPLGKVLIATGEFKLAANIIDHNAKHAERPPAAEPNAEFGKHLATVCAGCHHEDLAGGPIPGGPPDWPPSANLTPHADGLRGWTYDQFVATLRSGKTPSGVALREPMTKMVPYANNMTEVELKALWAYISTLPPVAKRK